MLATALRRVGTVGFALGIAVASPRAHAADASAWDGDTRSAVRLISGNPDGTTLRAGVEIQLAPGWKTYWRYPGDSGVPPRFDFAQSNNVKSVTLLWPAPRRFVDDGGQAIGYERNVIFPVRIVANDPARPVVLRLKLDYAVCEKLCVPAEGSVELSLGATPIASKTEPALVAAEARVPTRASIGDHASLAVRGVKQEPGVRYPRVTVDVAAPDGEAVDLLAEGPTPEWALPLPTPVADAPPGVHRFTFDLDGLPPGQSTQGASLTLTAIAGASAIEVKAALD
jgi:DsbC/DsbD-like thiol-disulfide interchange protein